MIVWFFALGALHIVHYDAPGPAIWLAAAFIGLPALYFKNTFRSFYLKVLLPFALGAALASVQLAALLDSQLPVAQHGSSNEFRVEIVSLVEQRERYQVFIGRIIGSECLEDYCQKLIGERVRLSWYKKYETLRPGEIRQGELKLKRPRGLVNPNGFDYHAWLLSQGIIATGYVKGELNLLGRSGNWASHRQQVRDALSQVTEGSEFKRFWLALVLADRSLIEPADWRILQNTGTIHLMAISGLHIGLVALSLFWLGLAIARVAGVVLARRYCGASFMLWIPSLLSMAGASYYAALAGFSIPTVRAMIACFAIHALRLLGWRLPHSILLGVAVAATAVTDPLASVLPSFWLSFGAVFCLLAIVQFSPSIKGHFASIRLWGRTQFTLCLAMSVPLLALGQFVSLSAPLANFIAVPIVSFVVVPLLLLASVLAHFASAAASILIKCIDFVFHYLWWALETLAHLPATQWWPALQFGPTTCFVFALGIAAILSPSYFKLRPVGLMLLAASLLLPKAPGPALRLSVLDVGQGTAMVLQVDGQTLVIDAGPRFSKTFDAGSRIVLPYLRHLGTQQINLLVSHDDLDHSGGVQGLLSGMPARSILAGEPIAGMADDQYRYCQNGDQWQLGHARFSILWPEANSELRGNAASCVLLVEFSDETGATQSILFSGDIDAKTEELILGRLPENVTVLIAPHHGSKSSSSFGFVRKLAPQYVVYSAGYANGYGHPHALVRRRYQRGQAVELNTADSGALVFEWNAQGLQISETKKAQHRPWFW